MTDAMMTAEQRLQQNIKSALGEKEWLILQLGTQIEILRQQPAPPASENVKPFLRPERPIPAEESGS